MSKCPPAVHQSLTIPDLWQQDAVRALREGRDVVVHAPTGAGKTYIFELFLPALKARPSSPCRPARWPTTSSPNGRRAAGTWASPPATWRCGSTRRSSSPRWRRRKGKFLQRRGPRLLVVDEYQMIADPVRGVNYELALALAPPETQLLLLSGSVANPQDVVAWLRRIGRDAVLVSHAERPVPLEEVDLGICRTRRRPNVRGRWPRLDRQRAARRSRPDPALRPAPQCRRGTGARTGRRAARRTPAAPHPRAAATRRPAARASCSRARVAFHHSGPQLRPARRARRAAGQGGPTPRGRRHHGPRRRHQFLHALGGHHRHPLHGRQFRAPGAAGRSPANVWPRRTPRAGRNRLRADRRRSRRACTMARPRQLGAPRRSTGPR